MPDHLTRDERERLRQVAASATDGFWRIHAPSPSARWIVSEKLGATVTIAEFFEEADAIHIVTFDPPAVLRLLAALDAAEANVERAAPILERLRELQQEQRRFTGRIAEHEAEDALATLLDLYEQQYGAE